jgi:hypothetical protein
MSYESRPHRGRHEIDTITTDVAQATREIVVVSAEQRPK